MLSLLSVLNAAEHSGQHLALGPCERLGGRCSAHTLLLAQAIDHPGQDGFEAVVGVVAPIFKTIERKLAAFFTVFQNLDDENLFLAGTAIHGGAEAVAAIQRNSRTMGIFSSRNVD